MLQALCIGESEGFIGRSVGLSVNLTRKAKRSLYEKGHVCLARDTWCKESVLFALRQVLARRPCGLREGSVQILSRFLS